MLRPAISEILSEKDRYYSFVLSVAKRARDVVDENNDRNEILVEKPVSVAVKQFKSGECIIVDNIK